MAGAPSGHASKSDIAPVSNADRTPGAKSAKKAPWRSPGVALSRRDENTPGGFVAPTSAPKSARARKLDARSPATAGSSKTRGGKPRLESDVSTEATPEESADGDDAVTSAVSSNWKGKPDEPVNLFSSSAIIIGADDARRPLSAMPAGVCVAGGATEKAATGVVALRAATRARCIRVMADA